MTQLCKNNFSHAKWESLLQRVLSKPDNFTKSESNFIIQLMIDLSMMAPFPSTFQTFQTDDNKLGPTLMTTLCQAAQITCGSNYTHQDKTATPTKMNPKSTFLQALQKALTTKPKTGNSPTIPHNNPYKSNKQQSNPLLKPTTQNSHSYPTENIASIMT